MSKEIKPLSLEELESLRSELLERFRDLTKSSVNSDASESLATMAQGIAAIDARIEAQQPIPGHVLGSSPG